MMTSESGCQLSAENAESRQQTGEPISQCNRTAMVCCPCQASPPMRNSNPGKARKKPPAFVSGC